MWDFTLFKIDFIIFSTLITHITLITFLQTTNIWTFIKLLFQLTLMFNLVMKKMCPLIQFPCIKRFVNSLMFLQINSWPNISYTIKIIGNYSDKPKLIHCNAINQILKYLKSIRKLALCHKTYLLLVVISNYATNIKDCKSQSQSWFPMTLNHGLIVWGNHKQGCNVNSTIQSECILACLATKEIVWMCHLLESINDNQSDNQSCIHLVHNPNFHCHTSTLMFNSISFENSMLIGLLNSSMLLLLTNL
jgi:hypothetical protein